MIQPHFHTCYFTAEEKNIQTKAVEWGRKTFDKAVIQVREDASCKQAFRAGAGQGSGVEMTGLRWRFC